MLEIEVYSLGPLATNAYVLTRRQSNACIVIDPGMNPGRLIDRVREMDVEAILLTHAHFDHIGGVEELRRLKGCPVYVHAAEADWLGDPELNGSALWPEVGPPIVARPADRLLAHGDTLQLLGESFRVYHTPGHSPGSVSFHWHEHVFSGDVLFQLSVGRTDLPGGSTKELYDSIHSVLFRFPDATRVHPGHGPETTIGFEKQHNPYV
jgi:glyoxylase-like metal-dependent hydrolase (beta-lactamase superfamily II)